MKKIGAKLIFATTTIVPEGEIGRIADDDAKYNEAALRVMKKYDVTVNDLHELTKTCGQNSSSAQVTCISKRKAPRSSLPSRGEHCRHAKAIGLAIKPNFSWSNCSRTNIMGDEHADGRREATAVFAGKAKFGLSRKATTADGGGGQPSTDRPTNGIAAERRQQIVVNEIPGCDRQRNTGRRIPGLERFNKANWCHRFAALGILLRLCTACSNLSADDFVPQPGKFPPAGVGTYLAGELVSVDHVNRRGAIRLVGDNNDDRYHWAPSHRFALLPYGMLRYHGAPAELRDIPIGTLLHGYFVLPPEGDTSVSPPDKNAEKYVPKQTHALLLEDDVSFYQRQGRAWKVVSIEPDKGKLKVTPVTVEPDANATRIIRRELLAAGSEKDGLQGEQLFEIDASTRVFKGKQFAELKDIAADQIVQLNLTWAPDWKNGQVHVADIWLDDESRVVATDVQRRIHIRQQRTRWLAGWVDHVEHQPGGQGIVAVTLFGGMDSSLYDAVKAQTKPGGGAALAAAESTLRSWWQEHDNKHGPVLEVKEIPNPPPGSSGLQLRVQLRELLDGFRPGRIVKVRPNGFPNVKLPPEERVKNLDDR